MAVSIAKKYRGMGLPRPITEGDFQNLEGATVEQVRTRAAPLVESFHAYLNRGSCLSDIQRIRHRWNPRTNQQVAFAGGDFPTDHEHWYTYNAGGRKEVQFNIGLFPEYFRVGLGFEMTDRMFGKPEKVLTAYDAFRDLVERDRPILDRFAQNRRLEIEWRPTGGRGKGALRYVEPQDVTGWLVARKKEADWVFVGRLLRRADDAEILGDPARLKEIMESVFRGFKPLWEGAQTEAARYDRR